MQDFQGRVAVVTGAASGFGRAFAERFGREGMKVVLADVDEAALATAVAELRGEGLEATGVPTDVSSRESVAALAEKTVETYGGVHLVCNNAGVSGYLEGPAWEASPKDWDWSMGVNFWGAVHGVEAFLPLMLAAGEGQIVNTASDAGFTSPNVLYSVTKHATVAYTELVFNHLRALDLPVRISILAPGASATPIAVRARPAEFANPPDPAREQVGERQRRVMHEVNITGPAPSEVAEKLIEGIRAEKFYIFVDDKASGWIQARTDAILARQDPPLPGHRIVLT